MTKYFQFNKKIFLSFFGFGILVFLLDMITQHYWMDFVWVILGEPNLGWDFQPTIFKYVQSFIAYSPWIILVIILIKDIVRKNFSRSISFSAGLAVIYVAFFITFFLIG